MKKGLQILIWIVVIIAVIAVFAFFWGKGVWNKISFSVPRPEGLDLQGLTLADLANIALTGQTKTVTATLSMDIKNDNNFSIPFSNIRVRMIYNDVVIAETSDMLAQNKVVPANSVLTVSDKVNIILNNAGGNLLIEKIKGGHPRIDYVISVRVFGIPLPSIKNSFVW